MAEKRNPLGSTGETVRANVQRLRDAQNLGFTKLARILEEIGRPIPELGLRRIESGGRRVDADDLVALSVALGVWPVTLLMPDVPMPGGNMPPDHGRKQEVEVTGLSDPMEAQFVWAWLRAERALPGVSRFEAISRGWPSWRQEQDGVWLDKLQDREAEQASNGDD